MILKFKDEYDIEITYRLSKTNLKILEDYIQSNINPFDIHSKYYKDNKAILVDKFKKVNTKIAFDKWLNKELTTQADVSLLNIEEFQTWYNLACYHNEEKAFYILNALFGINIEFFGKIEKILDCILDCDPKTFVDACYIGDENNGEFVVPDVLTKLVNLDSKILQNYSFEIGKLELAIPFLYKDSYWFGKNSIFDVIVNNEYWHIKASRTKNENIRMGSAKYSAYSGSDIQKTMSSEITDKENDVSISLNKKIVTKNKSKICEIYKNMDSFQRCLNKEMIEREFTTSNINGVILYVTSENKVYKLPKNSLYAGSASQGRYCITTVNNKLVV